jgi:polyphenol oxidase
MRLTTTVVLPAGYFGLDRLGVLHGQAGAREPGVERSNTGMAGDADGLVTDKPGLAVGVLVADCAALLFADPVNRIVAAVHAGWRGAVDRNYSGSGTEMEKIGAEPDLIHAYVSPCISRDVFEIGEEVACHVFRINIVDRTRGQAPCRPARVHSA